MKCCVAQFTKQGIKKSLFRHIIFIDERPKKLTNKQENYNEAKFANITRKLLKCHVAIETNS